MRFDLATLTRRVSNPRRSVIPLRPIIAPAMFATTLYRESYMPVVQVWERAIPSIVATYERTLAEMVTDSAADLSFEIGQVESSLTTLLISLDLRLGRWAQLVESWHRRKWRNNVISATTVDLGTLLGPDDVRETLDVIIQRNVGLITSVSDQTRQRIADAVFRGLGERKPSAQIAKELREFVAMSRRRARNIASDQTVKITSALNEERRRQAGIQSWEWVHSDKAVPRPEHVARDGKLYSDDPALVGDDYGGKTVRKPPEDRPGRLPFCGCTDRAVLIL